MWNQVKGVYNKMKPVMDAAKDGVNLICYSQGNKSLCIHIYIYIYIYMHNACIYIYIYLFIYYMI